MSEVATLVTTPIITDDEAQHILFDTAADLYRFDVDALGADIERVGFEVSDVQSRPDDFTRDVPEFNIDHITRGIGGLGRRPEAATSA
jgi:hypothetical protein